MLFRSVSQSRYAWLKGDLEVGNGKNLRVRASDITGVETYRFNAFKDGKLIAQAQISVADVIDGIDGQPGKDGVTYYTWLKYADSPTSGMSDSPTGKTYIGLAFNKTTPNESTNYSDYQWSVIKGADGVQGPPGANGQTTYVWLKYADNASCGGISDNPTGNLTLDLRITRLQLQNQIIRPITHGQKLKGLKVFRVQTAKTQ